jgi:hypothetical protein
METEIKSTPPDVPEFLRPALVVPLPPTLADTVRELTLKAIDEKKGEATQLDLILAQVNERATSGFFTLSLFASNGIDGRKISPWVQKKLREQGFIADFRYPVAGSSIYYNLEISWERPQRNYEKVTADQ